MSTLGRGTYSIVRRHITDRKIAEKVYTDSQDERITPDCITEILIASVVKSPYVIGFNHVRLDERQRFTVHMPRATMDLYSMIHTEGALPTPRIKKYAAQIAMGLLALHNRNVIHQDMKSGNILYYRDTDTMVICDMGISTIKHEIITDCNVYTCTYRAPEIWQHYPHTEKADVWALGCIIAEMYGGSCMMGYTETDARDWITFAISAGSTERWLRKYFKDPEMVDFLLLLLEVDPVKRYNIQQVLEHPFLSETTTSETVPGVSSEHTLLPRLGRWSKPLHKSHADSLYPIPRNQERAVRIKAKVKSIINLLPCLRQHKCPGYIHGRMMAANLRARCDMLALVDNYLSRTDPEFPDDMIAKYCIMLGYYVNIYAFDGVEPQVIEEDCSPSGVSVELEHDIIRCCKFRVLTVTVADYYLCDREDPTVSAKEAIVLLSTIASGDVYHSPPDKLVEIVRQKLQ